MTEETHGLVRSGLAAGLREHVAKLFSVYVNCQDQGGYDRCLRGLVSAIAAYEILIQSVDEDQS